MPPEDHAAAAAPGGGRTAEDAFAWLSRRLADLGITRLADITGLDRIGIPVVQAVRPLGLANTVTQGKGRDLAEAGVSAIMEAAEQVFSERIDRFAVVHASAQALGLAPDAFAPHLLGGTAPDWVRSRTAWLPAQDLIAATTAWVPFELVHTAYVEPPIPTDGLFFASTTGLACAFDVDAALRHALLECVERDAIARAHLTHGFFQRCRLDERTIEDAPLLSRLAQVREAGCTAAFWQAPAAGRLAVVWCQIMETERLDPILPFPADGFAAGFDVVAAATAALREAAQSRLAAISGARDDVVQTAHASRGDWIAGHRRLLATGPRPLSFGAGAATHGIEASLQGLLSALARHDGVASVLAIRLDSSPCPAIAAVRVVVPHLMPFA